MIWIVGASPPHTSPPDDVRALATHGCGRKEQTVGSGELSMLSSSFLSGVVLDTSLSLSSPLLSSVQCLGRVRLSATTWTIACLASLSFNSQSLLKLMSTELVMPSNHLILCHPLLLLPSIFPRIRVFSSESVLPIRWPKIEVSASASVLPMNIQD